jgi:hypothetical protein
MRTFLVSYELAKPHLNQPYLAEAIMSLGVAWARPLENVWYLRADAAQTDIEARLSRLIDENDGLLIQETRGDARMLNTGLRWFRQRRNAVLADCAGEEGSNVVAFPVKRPQSESTDDTLNEVRATA